MSVKLINRRALSVVAMTLVFSLGVAETADARRGGSFGSRGMRTYQAPRATDTAPFGAAPVRRSMTSPEAAPGATRPAAQAARPGMQQPQQGGFLRRWGGPILGGLAAAGLIGMLMGHGFGGAAGMMAMLMQVGLAALAVFAVVWLFRRFGQRQQPAFAGAAAQGAGPIPFPPRMEPRFEAPPQAAQYSAQGRGGDQADNGDEVGLKPADFDTFERMLGEIQSAFGREDYAGLRERTTPEIMSFLAEELSGNAVAGRRNEVRDVRLLQGDLAEAWVEAGKDYATLAMRYSSIDVMRDRADGRIVEGDERPTETTELWTFVRDHNGPWGGAWKLSAIQELEGVN
jgi:predicted lipid-binding transport protein (Tim44 family)